MENKIQPPIPVQAFMLLGGMMNLQVVSALVKTNIIESLDAGPQSADYLAVECKVNQNVLSRTLRFATLIGIVNFSDEKYSLTEIGRCFLKNVPGSLYGSASFLSSPPWRDSWNNFRYSLESGQPAFDHVFGKSFFDFLDTNEEFGKPFNIYMTQFTTMIVPAVLEAYDFNAFNTLCDVGGGQGILLKAVLEKTPHAQGILFDLESAMKHHVLGDFNPNVHMVSGSFFENIPTADCLILKTIIHDWNDENSQKILTNCRKALNPGGKIILIEQVIEEPFTHMSLFYDLHMQVMLGGSERTEEEFKKLFAAAGLKLNRIIPTKSPMKIIEASC